MTRAGWCCSLALAAALLAGCVERRMTIVSDPPGAVAFVNGKMIGATPVDVPSDQFVYYGNYDILLVRDGYEPLLAKQAVPPPWYQYFPLDFISENLTTYHFKDRRIFSYQLGPPSVVPPDDLLERAHGLRDRGQVLQPHVKPPTPGVLLQPPVIEELPAPTPGAPPTPPVEPGGTP